MAIGTFTLTGQFLGITGIPATGSVHIDGNPQTIVDPAGNKFKVGPRDEKLDIQGAFSITLPSDATTGNSTGIAYRVTVNLRHQNLPPINLYARPIGSTVDLADITSQAIPELTVLPAGPPGPALPADQMASLAVTIAADVNAAVAPAVTTALAADHTPADAAAAAVAAKLAAANVPTAQDLGDDAAWAYAVMYAASREAAFGLRKDGTFYPTPKVESDLANKLPDLDVSTGWRWAVYYQGGEVAFGQRTDGTYYPSSLGGTTTVNVVEFGDSLTANRQPQDAALATLLGRPVLNRGIGGQTSLEIAARQGGAPARATVTGGLIPASGSVTVTLDRKLRSDITTQTNVVIQGVAGSFIATDSTTNLTGTFTRTTAGLPIMVPANSPVQTGFSERDAWPIFWAGRNNFKQTDATNQTDFPSRIVSDLKAMMSWTNHQGHALILSIPPWVGEENGTSVRTKLDAANAAIRDAFPAQYVDMAAMIRNADVMTAVGVTPTAQDLTDISNGLTPVSFRNVGDDGHWNASAYAAANQILAMTYTSRGWI